MERYPSLATWDFLGSPSASMCPLIFEFEEGRKGGRKGGREEGEVLNSSHIPFNGFWNDSIVKTFRQMNVQYRWCVCQLFLTVSLSCPACFFLPPPPWDAPSPLMVCPPDIFRVSFIESLRMLSRMLSLRSRSERSWWSSGNNGRESSSIGKENGR